MNHLGALASYLPKSSLLRLLAVMRKKLEREDAALARFAYSKRSAFSQRYPMLHRVLSRSRRADRLRLTRTAIERFNQPRRKKTTQDLRFERLLFRLSPLRMLELWVSFHHQPAMRRYWRLRFRRIGKGAWALIEELLK